MVCFHANTVFSVKSLEKYFGAIFGNSDRIKEVADAQLETPDSILIRTVAGSWHPRVC